jgi:hypothetical protein
MQLKPVSLALTPHTLLSRSALDFFRLIMAHFVAQPALHIEHIPTHDQCYISGKKDIYLLPLKLKNMFGSLESA